MTERNPITPDEASAIFDRLLSGEWVDEQDIEAAATALPHWTPPTAGPEAPNVGTLIDVTPEAPRVTWVTLLGRLRRRFL